MERLEGMKEVTESLCVCSCNKEATRFSQSVGCERHFVLMGQQARRESNEYITLWPPHESGANAKRTPEK